MFSIEIIGLIAGTFTTIAFVPQVYQTWKSKSAKDLSLGMFSVFVAGIVLWLYYGIQIGDLPMILSNVFTLILASTLLFFKLTFKT